MIGFRLRVRIGLILPMAGHYNEFRRQRIMCVEVTGTVARDKRSATMRAVIRSCLNSLLCQSCLWSNPLAQLRIAYQSEEGILQTDTNDIEFSGNVVIRNEDYQLRTRRLSYEHERRLIFTKDPVQISGEDVQLSAKSLEYDLNLNTIILAGDVAAAVSRDFEAINDLGPSR